MKIIVDLKRKIQVHEVDSLMTKLRHMDIVASVNLEHHQTVLLENPNREVEMRRNE